MSIKKITILTMSVFFLYSCSKVPFSDRKQMNLLPESELVSMSLTSYKQFLIENPALPVGDANTDMVKRVGSNIQNAVVRYMTQNKMGNRIAGYKWEFNLVKSDEVNAWCMPGGKVVVYSGLLGVTQDEPSLAIVMGHEIAHAIARHGNERMSQQLLTQAGGVALNVAIAQKPEQTKAIFNTAYGAGTTVGVLLPFSRLHETEADKLGLIFAAMAGYDPHAAPAFWQRMAAKSNGAKPPELLSTHPSDQTRIKNLNAFMPQAMKYYKK